MKKTIFSYFANLLTGLVVLILIVVIFFLSIKSFPSPQPEDGAYPGPNTTSTLSPETICDQFFSFRKGLSDAQRQMIESDYQNCVNARKTPSALNVTKPTPIYVPQGEYTSPFLRRPAGIGNIVETNFSPLRSNYKIINQWVADINGIHFVIYAGGRFDDTANGDNSGNDLSWAGVLVVDASDMSGKYLLERSGLFWTPQNFGPVRIVSADSTTLTVAAINGESFLFNFESRSFLSSVPASPVTLNVGNGVLIESGSSPYQFNDYTFINQWSIIVNNNGRIIVLAGKEQDNPNIGVLVLLKVSSIDNANIIETDAYITNLDDGALRIISIENGNLILVSDSGLIYKFNINSQQFTSLPESSEPITLETNVSPVYNPEPGSIATKTPTRTPTRTPTPRPTKTALPTYNPYP
ncbi:MAG: hypothetical protein WAV05_19325 [Anaerolineales bacterium]